MNYPVDQEIILYGVEKNRTTVPEIKIQYNSKDEVKNIKISSSKDVADFIRNLYEEDSIEVQEVFYVLYLNRRNKIKGYYKHTVGSISETIVDLRIILAAAIKSLSTSIIIAHNHPSGNNKPSDGDIHITKKIREAAKLMDIVLLDSIIITTDNYYSFADEGRLQGLSGIDKKYTIADKEIERRLKREREATMKTENLKPKKVKSLSEEVKFIRRFVGLHKKVKTPNAVLNFIKSLQKSISQRFINKNSPFVKEIYYIQDTLIEFYQRMKGEMRILLEEKTLAKLAAISGGEEVYPSVGFIKTFIGMQGKEISEEKKELYVKRLYNAAKNRRIYPDDPFADKLQKIYNYFKAVYKPGQKVTFAKAELSGLSCICKAHDKALGNIYDTKGKPVRRCRSSKYSDAKKGACSYNRGLASPHIDLGKIFDTKGKLVRRCRSGKYSDAKKGACSYNKGLAGVADQQTSFESEKRSPTGIMNSMDFMKLKFQGIGFTGKWKNFIGDPSKGFTAMVFGMPKFGKSYLCVDFAGYLARNHGKVLYVAKEEELDLTLQKKLKEKSVAHQNLDVSDYLPNNLSGYDYVFLDSVSRLGLKPEDLHNLEKANPGVSLIYIFQVRKDGIFKGRNDFQHDVDIVIEVPEKGIAIQNGRFNQGGEMKIFDSVN